MRQQAFEIVHESFQLLMANGRKYRVPRYQRDYSWGEEEWTDLWQDILAVLPSSFRDENDEAHFMGYMVIQRTPGGTREIIDGQQRLTTVSLLVLAAIANLKRLSEQSPLFNREESEKNKQRMAALRGSYIGYLDPVSLTGSPKLTLNRHNDSYFQSKLVTLNSGAKLRLSESERLLGKALDWFSRKLSEKVSMRDRDVTEGEWYAWFITCMAERLVFTVILVENELNAFKVFESLNARGVRLTSADLLKNWLFATLSKAQVDERELDALESRWAEIVGNATGESFTDFVRAHWNSRNPFSRHAELFKRIRHAIQTRDQVYALLDGLESDSVTFAQISSPEGYKWSDKGQAASASAMKLFNVRQPIPLILAARRKFNDAGFSKVLRACEVMSFRYNVICGLPPNELELTYCGIARDLSSGELATPIAVIERLAVLCPSDEKFRVSFAEKSFHERARKIVRHILCALEGRLTGKPVEEDSQLLSNEHILPELAYDGWDEFDEAAKETFVQRLGNLTLMSVTENLKAADLPYQSKVARYRDSAFALTRDVAERWTEWSPGAVNSRQKWMADLAVEMWRLPT